MSGGAIGPGDVLRPEVLGWSAYHVAPSAGMVKLDAMENPYRLPPELREALARALADAAINRYPDAASTEVSARLRRLLSLRDGEQLLLGNGSDELIQILCTAVARPGAVVLGVEPSFVMYRVSAAVAGVSYQGVPLRPDFSLDLEAVLEAIRVHRPALVFLAHPNNPTGNAFEREAIETVLAASPGLVVVDEAYHAFARDTFMGELARHPNLLVMRTLSKLGLAGLRLGMLAGSAAWIGELDKLRLPYNINVLTQVAAAFALDHVDVLEAQADSIVAERAVLRAALEALPGVEVFPSRANFLTFRVADAPATFAGLKQAGVLIKNLHGAHPLLEHCLRVSVGTPEENRRFLAAIAPLPGHRESGDDR
jgi:histidinol-phosphate aminotransferase